jgi:hypothetical protein
MTEQLPLGDRVIGIFRGAHETRKRFGSQSVRAEQDLHRYGDQLSRSAGGLMLRHQTQGELPKKDDWLDLLRAAGGLLLSKAEVYAMRQARQQYDGYDAKVEAEIRELLEGTQITAACRSQIPGSTAYGIRPTTGGGLQTGLGMPDGPIRGAFLGLDIARPALHLSHPDETLRWEVGIIDYRGRQLVDLTVEPTAT